MMSCCSWFIMIMMQQLWRWGFCVYVGVVWHLTAARIKHTHLQVCMHVGRWPKGKQKLIS